MTKRKKSSEKHTLKSRMGAFISLVPHLRLLAGVALIAIAAFVAYFPSINGEFILDDDKLVTANAIIKASDGLWRFWCTTEAADYWPMTNTTFWIEWRLWGINPAGYHVTNLILHIAEALLIWIILRKLSIPGAIFAALIFAVHPVNVESVAWISQRKNTMAMLFFLLSILWYLKAEMQSAHGCHAHAPLGHDRQHGCHAHACRVHDRQTMAIYWYWLSLTAFLLAMLSKGSVVVLPVLLLGIVWWLRPLTKRDLARTAPFFAVALVLGIVNVWFQRHGNEAVIRVVSPIERLLGAGGVVWFYLYKALLPIDLAFIYPQWNIKAGNWLWWLPLLAALIVTTVLVWYRMSWSRPFLFAWVFFCAALVPVMGFTDVGFMIHSLVADHYQHIAIIGVIALASAGFGSWHRRAQGGVYWAATVAAIAAVGILMFLTWRQSGLYRDPMTLYQATLEKNPDCWIAHNNLGLSMSDPNRLQEIIDHYRQAIRLKPDYADAHNNLGVALIQIGRIQEATEQFLLALRIKPDYSEAHNNMGYILLRTGQVTEAEEHLRRAVSLKPDYPKALNNLGTVLLNTGRLEEAAKCFEQTLRLDPNYSDAENNLGVILTQTDRPEEAIKHYEQALRLNPKFSEAHNNLGSVLSKVGRFPEAIEHYEQSLRLEPNSFDTHNNLGVILVKTDRPWEAIKHFKQALEINPDYIDAWSNLALVYAITHQSSEAVAAAEKALELTRSQGMTEKAKQIENWLNSYRAGLSSSPNTPSPSKSALPTP